MRIPPNADPDLAACLKELDERLQRLGSSTSSSPDPNLQGRRITNAGAAQGPADYTTFKQVIETVQSAINSSEARQKVARADLLSAIMASARASTAPAALADVPEWLATVIANVPR